MNPLRQLLGFDLALKRINEVAKNKKKLLKLQDSNLFGQLLAVRLLCVSVILLKILFYYHIFHVNEVIKINNGSQFSLKTHQQSDQNKENY